MVAETGFIEPDSKKVIAISLYNASSDHTWGVVRNAQLMPIIYPGWTLKVYTNRSLIQEGYPNVALDPETITPYISDRVIKTLQLLKAEVIFVDSITTKRIPPQLWSYLVADEREIEVFLIRLADNRISEREFTVVNTWINSRRRESVFVIKDHPKYSNMTLIDGLWGARSNDLRTFLGNVSMETLLEQHEKEVNIAPAGYLELIYSKVQDDIVFYDSITCDKPRSIPFPEVKRSHSYIGQKYNAHEQLINNDIYVVLNSRNPKCQQN